MVWWRFDNLWHVLSSFLTFFLKKKTKVINRGAFRENTLHFTNKRLNANKRIPGVWRWFLLPLNHLIQDQAVVFTKVDRHETRRRSKLSAACPLSPSFNLPAVPPGAAGVSPRQEDARSPAGEPEKLPNSCLSYLVDILRYTVHLVGSGHPCWSVSQNHRLRDFLFLDKGWGGFFFSPPNCVMRGKPQLLAENRSSCLPVTERDELVWLRDPCFYRKVLRCALRPHRLPTQPVSPSVRLGAQRRTHSRRGGAAFRSGGKLNHATRGSRTWW